MKLGNLNFEPVEQQPELVAETTKDCIKQNSLAGALVAEINDSLADTAAFCAHYGIGMDVSANCVIVEAKRAERVWYAACIILATTRADINGIIRKHLDARKLSFAPMETAVSLTKMEYSGITPIGLPGDWPILIDSAVMKKQHVVVGSGVRASKLLVPTKLVASLPNVEILDITKV